MLENLQLCSCGWSGQAFSREANGSASPAPLLYHGGPASTRGGCAPQPRTAKAQLRRLQQRPPPSGGHCPPKSPAVAPLAQLPPDDHRHTASFQSKQDRWRFSGDAISATAGPTPVITVFTAQVTSLLAPFRPSHARGYPSACLLCHPGPGAVPGMSPLRDGRARIPSGLQHSTCLRKAVGPWAPPLRGGDVGRGGVKGGCLSLPSSCQRGAGFSSGQRWLQGPDDGRFCGQLRGGRGRRVGTNGPALVVPQPRSSRGDPQSYKAQLPVHTRVNRFSGKRGAARGRRDVDQGWSEGRSGLALPPAPALPSLRSEPSPRPRLHVARVLCCCLLATLCSAKREIEVCSAGLETLSGLGPSKAWHFLPPLLTPIRSLRDPRSLTMAFSRRFLACRPPGVPSEHGPLLSHLSVDKQSTSSHTRRGPGHGRGMRAPGAKGRFSGFLGTRSCGSPASPAARPQGCMCR